MNPELDNQLEAEIDRQLKDLPDLAAPSSLVPRTVQMIAGPAVRWHSRSWATWPGSIRAAYLVVAFGVLAGTVPGMRALDQYLVVPMFARFAHWRAGVEWLWHAASALGGAATLVVDHAGREVILSCILAVVLAYAACVGFGTVFVRLALSGPRKS
jgi:hypothetical protein